MVHADLPYKQASCARQQRDFCSFAMSLLDMNIHISAWETPCLQICVQKKTCELSNLPFTPAGGAEIVHLYTIFFFFQSHAVDATLTLP